MKLPAGTLSLSVLLACSASVAVAGDPAEKPESKPDEDRPFVYVLGIAQDAGFPQAGCKKACCAQAWRIVEARRRVASLAIVDPQSDQRWIIDCTPDFPDQLQQLMKVSPPRGPKRRKGTGLDGILLTHAHIGHYSGLVHLGREVMGARDVPVWAMPRMRKFLESNGPWSQLVSLKNIHLKALKKEEPIQLNSRIRVTPFVVPHRDEFSETVGFRITGPDRTAVYIPDIDKWERWDRRIEDVIASADVAWLDGTFYANGEIPGRDMSLIPHPFIEESLARFARLRADQRGKVRFIHLNHTNPALNPDSAAARQIRAAGCAVAVQGERFGL